MIAMVRRLARIFCTMALLLLVATAVVTQFCDYRLDLPWATLFIYRSGVDFCEGHPGIHYDGQWDYSELLEWPIFDPTPSARSMFLPWWLLLFVWGVPTAAVWWITRRRTLSGRAFPIEPNPPPPG
jgi:hypothetical protein